MIDETELLTMKEVATTLKLSRSTVYRLRASGEIPSVKIGGSIRVRRLDLELMLIKNSSSLDELEPDYA